MEPAFEQATTLLNEQPATVNLALRMEHERMRRDVWIRAYESAVRRGGSYQVDSAYSNQPRFVRDIDTPGRAKEWADAALKAFDFEFSQMQVDL